MPDKAPAWVVPVMRAGYFARAAVYTVVGALAVTAAIKGGAAQGTTDALADLKSEPWGTPLLFAVGLGLFAYTLWRLVDAWMDLEDYGHDAKGILARAGLTITGLIHAGIGVSVISLALGQGGSGGGGTQSAVQRIMELPYGKWVVAGVGLVTIGAGIYYAYKGIAEKYKEHIRVTRTTRRLDPVLKFGCIAEGAVIGIIGILIVFAGLTANASEAGGLGQALGEIRQVAYGRILLAVVGLGLVAFAVENVIEGVYRVIPRRAGPDVMTMARRAKLEAEGKLDEALA
ncbi:DUF1206 domain-containing protein [Primorskyibacter sp. 2E107]|uniref:DUF1206 domain-containing protein n=1 Tax=Primorskyibacter sp. 2E107 TaxID=3403458 RepID=UPI003AF9ADD5